ncbi:MAG: hypothetical protein IKP09_10580 [Lentisphaeria bacterium]|nr:hypothetical protein [Lentisphaeria bacterium]
MAKTPCCRGETFIFLNNSITYIPSGKKTSRFLVFLEKKISEPLVFRMISTADGPPAPGGLKRRSKDACPGAEPEQAFYSDFKASDSSVEPLSQKGNNNSGSTD